jgi:hypothetical protein
MEPSVEYQPFAQESAVWLSRQKPYTRILEEMAQAWEKLARENDVTIVVRSPHAGSGPGTDRV